MVTAPQQNSNCPTVSGTGLQLSHIISTQYSDIPFLQSRWIPAVPLSHTQSLNTSYPAISHQHHSQIGSEDWKHQQSFGEHNMCTQYHQRRHVQWAAQVQMRMLPRAVLRSIQMSWCTVLHSAVSKMIRKCQSPDVPRMFHSSLLGNSTTVRVFRTCFKAQQIGSLILHLSSLMVLCLIPWDACCQRSMSSSKESNISMSAAPLLNLTSEKTKPSYYKKCSMICDMQHTGSISSQWCISAFQSGGETGLNVSSLGWWKAYQARKHTGT